MSANLHFLLLFAILWRRSLEPSLLPQRQKVINGGGNALHHFLCLLRRARLSMNVSCTLISITIIDLSLNNGRLRHSNSIKELNNYLLVMNVGELFW